MNGTEILKKECKWITANKRQEIKGIKIKKGCYYIGSLLRYDGVNIIGAYINQGLPISNKEQKDRVFTSYSDMNEFQRYQYLLWLSDNDVPQHYLVDFERLYLFGLEIRFFMDNISEEEKVEIIHVAINEWRKSNEILNDSKGYVQLQNDFQYFIDSAIIDSSNEMILAELKSDEISKLKYSRCTYLKQLILSNHNNSTNIHLCNIIKNFINWSQFIPQQYINEVPAMIMYEIEHEAFYKNIHVSKRDGFKYIQRTYSPLDFKPYPLFRSRNAHYPEYNYKIKKVPENTISLCAKIEYLANHIKKQFDYIESLCRFKDTNEETPLSILALPKGINIMDNTTAQFKKSVAS